MRVLLTGAGGNLGQSLAPILLERGHHLRTFDLPTAANQRALSRFGSPGATQREPARGKLEPQWGDLRDPRAVASAVSSVDAIVHLGAITPPQSELVPDESRAVNVTGTRNVLEAALARASPPKVLFASSVAVYGRHQLFAPAPEGALRPAEPSLLHERSPLAATDHYSSHKIACEEMLRASSLRYTILRLGISLPQRPSGGDPRWFSYLFEHSLNSRVHFIHPRDAAEALARALERDDALGRVLCVAGGEACRITQRELLTTALETVGLGMLPETAFGSRVLFGDWLDTRESQRVLGDYQQHSWADFAAELRQAIGLRRWGVGLLAPFARSYMLRYSECYQRSRRG
jgi:UDP-glucose 4-epimerase